MARNELEREEAEALDDVRVHDGLHIGGQGVAVVAEPGFERGRIVGFELHRLIRADHLARDDGHAVVARIVGTTAAGGAGRRAARAIDGRRVHRNLCVLSDIVEERVGRKPYVHEPLRRQNPREGGGVARVLDLVPKRRLRLRDAEHHAVTRHLRALALFDVEAPTTRRSVAGAKHSQGRSNEQRTTKSRKKAHETSMNRTKDDRHGTCFRQHKQSFCVESPRANVMSILGATHGIRVRRNR